MDTTALEAEFWRWFLKEHFMDFQDISPHQQTLNNQQNIFQEHQNYDLAINLEDGICTDSRGGEWSLMEYVASKNGNNLDATEMRVEVEYNRWEERKEAEQANLKYVRDTENMCWKKRTGDGDSFEPVTDFDIILTSIIEKFDIKTQEWERYYQATLRREKMGRIVSKDVKLTPSEVHTTDNFSSAAWDKALFRVQNMRRNDMRDFWFHVNMHFQPREVREFNHYGFIEFENEKYFLGENVLIRFPDQHNKPLELIAEDEGAFPVGDNKYIKPPEDAANMPHFELGVPQNGIYKKTMKRLLNNESFERELAEVEEHFCNMVGGKSDFRMWGKLIVAYVFSFLFFEDIYDHYKHVIFLYFYGEANVGKGEVVKRIFDFFGINYIDSLNTPKARTVDVAIEEKSQIPMWIDEHVPEVPGKDADIADQTWNSWFELKMRRTSIRKGESWGTERKEVRTMPVFCSNFKPRTDHLLSRCIIMEYGRDKRGPEKHVIKLKNNKDLLQLLMLSFMQNYNLIDREAFRWDMDRIRGKLKNDVKAELNKRSGNAILQDRQISQFAALIAVRHWLNEDYRNQMTGICRESQLLVDEENETLRKTGQRQINNQLKDMLDNELYHFVKNQIVKSAVMAAQHDPLSNYLETIGTLIQAHEIHDHHFCWTKEGHLKIWAKAVWDQYLKFKRGTDDLVRRETVESKLKKMSELSDDGSLKTVNWTAKTTNRKIAQKGFYIKNASKKEIFRNAFHINEYGPALSQLADDEQAPDTRSEEDKVNESFKDGEIPF